MAKKKVGLWLIGACGGVGTTAALGLAAIRNKLSDTTSLVTELPLFETLKLDSLDSFVVGGHEIRKGSFVETAQEMHQKARVFDAAMLAGAEKDLSESSSMYAWAAVELGMPFVNFTPSLGASFPAIQELAKIKGAPLAGQDGKTGETLMKSVLAPMFALRNWKILSWVGHNIFGNRDGIVLDDPANKASKIKTKDQVISSIVGYKPQTLVTIEYIPSMDDWKTAWNHIHYQGFLGTPMILQFIWQGCDSILAAPLVIDLARFALFAKRRGESGIMRHLSCFFKGPMGETNHDFFQQFEMLRDYVEATGEKS
ncbi:hypothetical protein EBX93_01540 [bacterium]|nr:hypothetical protein [bacterium]